MNTMMTLETRYVIGNQNINSVRFTIIGLHRESITTESMTHWIDCLWQISDSYRILIRVRIVYRLSRSPGL